MKYDNESLDDKVGFIEDGHRYEFKDGRDFTFNSVTTLIKNYYDEFDEIYWSEKKSKDVLYPLYGMTAEEIRKTWREKAKKASSEGTILHAYGEDLLNKKDVEAPNLVKVMHVPNAVDYMFNTLGYKLAKTELLVYSEALALAGQSDIVLKKRMPGDTKYSYAIYDWKFLSKKIEMTSYYNPYTRKFKMMTGIFKNLKDCNWIHYSIQLAIYQTLTGNPESIKEKVLVVVRDEGYDFIPCHAMRVFWDEDLNLQVVHEMYNGKFYDSRTDKITNSWPKDVAGR